jgi:hypothetical protein
MNPLPSVKLRLFLTCWILFAVHFATNVVREHYPAFSLAEHGTFQVDEYQGFHSDIFAHTDGHSYIGNNVATSVVAAAPLFLFDPVLDALEARGRSQVRAQGTPPQGDYWSKYPLRQRFFAMVKERGLHLRFGAATFITSAFLMAPLSALFVVLMYSLLVSRGLDWARAAWFAFLFAFATPVFFRTAHLTNNMFVMYGTFAAFCLLWDRAGEADAVSLGRRLTAGLCAGFALAADYSGVVPLVCLYGYLVFGRLSSVSLVRSVRESIPFILGSVPPVLFLLYSQWAMYGHPFLPGQYWMPAVNYTDRGWRGFSPPALDLFLLNLFHPSYGMLAFAPLLLLGMIPALRYRSDRLLLPRRERVFVAGFVTLFLLFCAANQYSRMQWNCGFRYLLPLVPLLFLAACDHLARLPRAALVAVSVPALAHSWILCMARDCLPPGDSWRYADSFLSWLRDLQLETVPASYTRIWNEGIQLPWLAVWRHASPGGPPILHSPWLPIAILAGCGVVILAIWRGVARRDLAPPTAERDQSAAKPLPTVEVVVPVLNEAHVLEKSIRTLRGFLLEHFPYPARILIADNGSTDGTGDVARRLTERYEDVSMISLRQKGRGRALRAAWTQSTADIVAYTDVDLSTELPALEKLCRAIHEDGYEIGTGSRLLRGCQVTRCFKREVISRAYNLFLKCALWTHFSDAQCGFKAVSRRVVDELIPLVKDQAWFFDTELLVLGEKLGYPIKDVPVRWIEDLDSRVKIISTAWEDIKGVCRLRWLLWSGQLPRTLPARRRPEPVRSADAQPPPTGRRVLAGAGSNEGSVRGESQERADG